MTTAITPSRTRFGRASAINPPTIAPANEVGAIQANRRQLSRLARQPLEMPAEPDPAVQPLRQVELWDLVSAFGRLMRETLALQPQQLIADDTPIHVYMESLLRLLQDESPLAFSAVFSPPHNRSRLVGLFLAVLELIKSGQISAEQPESFGDIWLRRIPQAPPQPTTPTPAS